MVGDSQGILPNTDKKRKRTSIAAPEKRLLEDYFRLVLPNFFSSNYLIYAIMINRNFEFYLQS